MIDIEIPPEYLGAEVSPVILDLMRKSPDWQTIMMIGPAGIGKTTQMYAMKARWDDVLIVSECMDISRNWKDHELVNELIRYEGILCVDDLGYTKPSEWCKDVVYTIATERLKHALRTVWSTNLSKDALTEQYSSAIASRLLGGIVHSGKGEDKRSTLDKTAITKKREAEEAAAKKLEVEIAERRVIEVMMELFVPEVFAIATGLADRAKEKAKANGKPPTDKQDAIIKYLECEDLQANHAEIIMIEDKEQREYRMHEMMRAIYPLIVRINELNDSIKWPDDIAAILPDIMNGEIK